MLHRSGSQFISQRLREHKIGPGQHQVLLLLSDAGVVNQEFLARIFMVDKANITRIVRILERNGFVRRDKNKNDKRANDLTLTAKGRKVIPVITTTIEEWDKILAAPLDDVHQHAFSHILQKICTARAIGKV